MVLAQRLEDLEPAPNAVATAMPEMSAWGIPVALVLLMLSYALARQKHRGVRIVER